MRAARLGSSPRGLAGTCQHSPAARGPAALACNRSCSPVMPVVRPVSEQQEQACRRQALAQALQQRLGLRIQPVQILTDQQQGRPCSGAAAAAWAGAVSVCWRRCVGSSCQKGLSAGRASSNARSTGTVSWRAASGVSTCSVTLACMVGVVTLLQMAITSQRLHREVGGGLAVGHRGAVEALTSPACGPPGQTRPPAAIFPPRLAYHRHHLAVPRPGTAPALCTGQPAPSAAPQSGGARALAVCKRRRRPLAWWLPHLHWALLGP